MTRHPATILVRALLLAAACGLIPVAAAAAPKSSQAKAEAQRERSARTACLNGDHTKGVAILSDLFVDTHDPTYIFNQGRCFEQNRRYEDAIARFEEYLRVAPALSAEDKALAKTHIVECRERLGQPAGRAGAPTTPSPPEVPPQPISPLPPLAPVVTVAAAQPQASPSSGRRLRISGIVAASVGAAALVGGVLCNAKVNSMASDMESTPGGYSAGKESDRKTYETLGWVGYGVGAAALATGAVLYVIGVTSGVRGSSVALVPAVGAEQAGAMLQGAF